MFRDGVGEGAGVCTRDARDRCVALHPGERGGGRISLGRRDGTHPQDGRDGRGIDGRGRRTRSTIKEGMLSISNDSENSGFVSASKWSKNSDGYFRASSSTTSVICLHGCADGTQKYRRYALEVCGEETLE